MIVATIEAISKKLHKFAYPIYVNDLPQGYKEPCFFIIPIKLEQEQIRGRLYAIHQTYDIHFFKNDRMEGIRMGAKLCDELEFIPYFDDKPIRGVNMSYTFTDGVTHFIVSYDLLARKPLPDVPIMKKLKAKEGVTNGG